MSALKSLLSRPTRDVLVYTLAASSGISERLSAAALYVAGRRGHGLRVGPSYSCCCANLIATLFVIGIMDLRTMAAMMAAITAERLARAGERVARAIGAVAVGAELLLIARAAGLG